MRRVALPALYVVALVAAAVLFRSIDAGSHSASDTIRPFLISVLPIVLVALIATRWLRRA